MNQGDCDNLFIEYAESYFIMLIGITLFSIIDVHGRGMIQAVLMPDKFLKYFFISIHFLTVKWLFRELSVPHLDIQQILFLTITN